MGSEDVVQRVQSRRWGSMKTWRLGMLGVGGVVSGIGVAVHVAAAQRAGAQEAIETEAVRQETGKSTQAPVAGRSGAFWKAMTSAEKQAYVSGFLAGAAAEQARSERMRSERAKGRTGTVAMEADTMAVSGSIDALHAAHGLRFPFTTAVYLSQLDDFYWWDNHALIPIADAMTEVNTQLRVQQSGGP